MTLHDTLVFLHVLLAIYWLGPDWGVYVTSHYIAKPGLPIDERRRFLAAMLKIDLLPRSCLIVFPAVGFQLAANLDLSPVTGNWLAAVWVFCLVWLVVSWLVYLNKGPMGGELLRRIDNGVRYVVAPAMVLAGAYSLVTGAWFGGGWLALKVMVFGVIVALGLVLRSFVGLWVLGFRRLAAEGANAEVETLFTGALAKAKPVVYVFWGSSAVMAFLGVTKPF
ncbi:MAG: hypothetical protein FJX59_11585 [Alphaproteobacteria bacterium]|nr:hypothetical protein [Alphaproteobacteria bacterium]